MKEGVASQNQGWGRDLALARITGLNFTSKYILKLNYW
jgi:hypothetical protein